MSDPIPTRKLFFYGDSNTYGYDPRGFAGDRYPASVRWTGQVRKAFAGRCEFEFDGVNGRSIPSSLMEIRWLEKAVRSFGDADYIALMLGTNDLFLTGRPDAAKAAGRMREVLRELSRRFSGEEAPAPSEEVSSGKPHPSRKAPGFLLVVPPLIAPSAAEGTPAWPYRQESARLAQEYRRIAEELSKSEVGAGSAGLNAGNSNCRIRVIDTTVWPIEMAHDQVHFSEAGCRTFGTQMIEALEEILEEDTLEDALRWEPVKVEHLIQDRWMDLRKVEYRFPDGSTFTPYYNYTRRSYVVIAASDEEGRFLCVRQFRHGIGEVTTEFPAGGIECGGDHEYLTPDSVGAAPEDALEAAKRELEEETGYTSDDWSPLLTVPSNATIADNYAFLFRARNCRRTAAPHTDDTEFLRMITLSPQEIDDLIARGKFQQAIHILAWLLVKQEMQER